ncbi:MAG: hypothetical protein ABR905_06780 [Terracidiphilus sp.]
MIAVSAGLSLAAQAGTPEAIEQKLLAEFKSSRITDDRSEIVTPGDRVIIGKPGLMMYAVASPMPPLYTYRNGKIAHGLLGLGKDLEISVRTPGGTSADYPHRVFIPGERCWVTGLQVQKDGVLFRLYSDRYEDTRYYANLKIAFPNRKEIPKVDEVLQLVAEVLTVAPAEIQVAKPAPTATVAPVINPVPKNQPVSVLGRFDFDEGDSQLNFVSDSGCIMVGPGGTQSAGKYQVKNDTLTMDCTVTGSASNLKIQGDKLIADDGHTWLREAVAPPLAPAVSIGQTKAQVTAALGQPVKTSKAGGKEIFYYKDMKVTFANGKVAAVE